MGNPFSLLGNLGLPGVDTFATDQVYKKYFEDKNIDNFEKFHVAFIEFCNEINKVLPGKHYIIKPSPKVNVKDFYETNIKGKSKSDMEKALRNYLKENITEYKANEKSMILAGMVAPPAAIALKRAGENTPQLKKFRLHIIPNFVFVPTCTLLALVGVRAFQIKSRTTA